MLRYRQGSRALNKAYDSSDRAHVPPAPRTTRHGLLAAEVGYQGQNKRIYQIVDAELDERCRRAGRVAIVSIVMEEQTGWDKNRCGEADAVLDFI